MQTIREYINWAKGRRIDTDGVTPENPYQCADVIKLAMTRCWNIPNFAFSSPSNPHGYAKGLYLYFDEHPELKGKFIRIKNTPDFVPRLGDIIEWNGNIKNTNGKPLTGVAGHTALGMAVNGNLSGNTQNFTSLDQNWGGKAYCAETLHHYRGVLGVIRPLQKCTIADLNVRSGPGKDYEKIGELAKGSLVIPIKYEGSWAYIGEGRWVSANYID